jgi:pilus assembly protein Flp/PilA
VNSADPPQQAIVRFAKAIDRFAAKPQPRDLLLVRGLSKKGGGTSMSLLTALIASFRRDEEGQGLAEYALILALIAIVAIVALIFLGNQISGILNAVGQSV